MALTTNRIRTTTRSKMLMNSREGSVGATAGWTTTDNGLWQCPASQTSSTLVIPISGVSIGDTITALRLRGGTAGAAAKTIVWALWKNISVSGAITATLVQTLTGDTTGTAHAIDIETYLTIPQKVTIKENYFVLITATTAAGVTIDITGIELDVKRTFGQEQ